jgi:hypothetical protein
MKMGQYDKWWNPGEPPREELELQLKGFPKGSYKEHTICAALNHGGTVTVGAFPDSQDSEELPLGERGLSTIRLVTNETIKEAEEYYGGERTGLEATLISSWHGDLPIQIKLPEDVMPYVGDVRSAIGNGIRLYRDPNHGLMVGRSSVDNAEF